MHSDEHTFFSPRVNVVCPGPVETDAYVSRTGDVRDVDSVSGMAIFEHGSKMVYQIGLFVYRRAFRIFFDNLSV